MVNTLGSSSFTIYDKSDGSVVAGPSALSDLWTAGGACAVGDGDPIVVYDRLAGRWLMSEFAKVGNHLCVYVSRTGDPVSGGWYNYDFQVPQFPDYPKYAVWPDAYYVSSNENFPTAYALERSRMLAGLPARFQRFRAPYLEGFGFQALTPSDLDGANPPPAGSPNFFVRHRDDEAHDPGANDPTRDFLEIWEFHADFNTPSNAGLVLSAEIPISEFDSRLCGLTSEACFPQPSTNRKLDPLREVVMWRLQYRNFGAYETLVGNFVTDVDGGSNNHGGIRWFELRRTGSGPWFLFQEGTWAPDVLHRWMGSIAMDGSGNMALGYSVSHQTLIYPSIFYVGRTAMDPLGVMTTGEAEIKVGRGSQSSSNRWGDYSSMNVDPVDDCTFWYTNEFVGADGAWKTRIAAFRFPFPTCVDAPADFCHQPGNEGAVCDDGDACTMGDQCSGGVCSGVPLTCPGDGNPCTDDFCDPATGGCVKQLNNGAPACVAAWLPGVLSVLDEEPACGNGIVEPGEACDDGNPIDGDGCDGSCQVEKCFTCAGAPSVCGCDVGATCGTVCLDTLFCTDTGGSCTCGP